MRENTRTALRVDGSSTSREREAGGREEKGKPESSTERGRKASERGGSIAGRRETAASNEQQRGEGRQGNCGLSETLKRYKDARVTCHAGELGCIQEWPKPP